MKRLLFIAFCLLLASCSPRHLPPVQQDSTYAARVDSVYVRDSIYIDRFRTIKAKADTVYVIDVRTEYKYKYKEKAVHDTTYLDRKVTEYVDVPAELSWWQRLWIRAGKVLSAVFLLILAGFFIRRIVH